MLASFAKRLDKVRTLQPSTRQGAGRRSTDRSSWRTVSLATSLVALVGVVALPLMILGGYTVWLEYRNERAVSEQRFVGQAQTIALLVDKEFERTVSVAQVLAASVAAAHGNLDDLEGEFRAARDMLAASLPPGSSRPILTLMDAKGMWLLHSEWASGERRSGLPGTAIGMAAVAAGETKISDLFISARDRVPLVAVAVPAFARDANPDGTRDVIGGIGISVPRQRLIAIVEQAGLPPGAIASVLDRRGVTVARSFRDQETVGSVQSDENLRTMVAAPSGLAPTGSVTLENVPSALAFARAPYSGYLLKIEVPQEIFFAPLREALFRSAVIGILLLIDGLVLALIAARAIVKSFRRAIGDAARGTVPDRSSSQYTGLREADDLAALLGTAIADREQAAESVRALLDNSPVGIIIFDAAGEVLQANDAFLSMVGHTQEEFRSGTFQWDKMTHDVWVERDATAFAEALARGRCTPYEKEYLHSDGTVVPVLISFSFTESAKGLAAAFVMDLTEQRRHQAAQHEMEDQLRFSLEAGHLGAWDLDLTTRTLRCSDIGQQLYGRALSRDVTLAEFLQMAHRDDRDDLSKAILRAVETGKNFSIEYRVVWPDETIHWLEVRGRVVQEAGRPARLAGVSADITERKHAEAAVRDSEAWLRAITDTMPQIVWSARPDGYHDYYNRRWYELTGATPGQPGGECSTPVIHPDDWDRAGARWQHSLATGEPYEAEYRLRVADGSYRWVLGRAFPMRDPDGSEIRRWFGTCTDIHDTVAARELLARSHEDLEQLVAERTKDLHDTQIRLAQAQRMEALGQLAGGIAHDFNNVLQAVQGAAALLARRPTDAAYVRRHSHMILEVTERGAAITRRLLAFSRRGDLRAEPVDPTVLQTSIRDILAHTLGDGVKVAIELARDLPWLLADEGQLETVLINLATNARDAMSGIGTLTLAARAEIVSPDYARQHPARLASGSYVRLSVSDTGVGMDSKTLSRASEPFFTTKPVGQGTGLGLAMARGFAEQSGGGLHIESEPGRGTTVSLWFPVAEPAGSAAVSPARDVGPAVTTRRSVRLLLVDDDSIVRAVTAELMEATGFEVLEADCAAAAIELLETGAHVDVLISDLSMPDMDGITLIHEAQRRRPGLPAILLTGFATNAAEIAVDGALSGAFSLLRKPVQGRQLAERVTELLAPAPASG